MAVNSIKKSATNGRVLAWQALYINGKDKENGKFNTSDKVGI